MHKSRRSANLTGGAKGTSHEPTIGSSRVPGGLGECKDDPASKAAGGSKEIPSGPASGSSDPCDCLKNKAMLHVCREVLREYGFSQGDIEDALKECGSDLQRTVEFCIQRSGGMELDAHLGPTSDEDAHLALMKDMGFHVRDIPFV